MLYIATNANCKHIFKEYKLKMVNKNLVEGPNKLHNENDSKFSFKYITSYLLNQMLAIVGI